MRLIEKVYLLLGRSSTMEVVLPREYDCSFSSLWSLVVVNLGWQHFRAVVPILPDRRHDEAGIRAVLPRRNMNDTMSETAFRCQGCLSTAIQSACYGQRVGALSNAG